MAANIKANATDGDYYLTPYKSYIAALTQQNTVLNDGPLEIGKMYRIGVYIDGDDFTNVGASSNASLVYFRATGTTPAWTNGTTIIGGWDPQVYVYNSNDANYIGDIIWTSRTFDSDGSFTGTLAGAFKFNKTWVMISQDNRNDTGINCISLSENEDEIYIQTIDMNGELLDGKLYKTCIEIRVYP